MDALGLLHFCGAALRRIFLCRHQETSQCQASEKIAGGYASHNAAFKHANVYRNPFFFCDRSVRRPRTTGTSPTSVAHEYTPALAKSTVSSRTPKRVPLMSNEMDAKIIDLIQANAKEALANEGATRSQFQSLEFFPPRTAEVRFISRTTQPDPQRIRTRYPGRAVRWAVCCVECVLLVFVVFWFRCCDAVTSMLCASGRLRESWRAGTSFLLHAPK